MKKNLKRILIALSFLVFMTSMVGLYACKDTPTPTTTNLNIIEQEVAVIETFSKKVEVSCDNASAIVWKSNDESIATVSGGVVTGVRQGQTKITATYNGVTDEVSVVVRPFDYSCFSVSADKYFINMYKGATEKITAQIIYDSQVLDGQLSFESLDTDVVTVSSDGTVTAKGFGVSAITIKGLYNGKSTSTIVNVSVESSIVLSAEKTSYDLNIGDESEVAIELTCSDNGTVVENPSFTYDLGENEDVVTITSDGKMVAKNSGSTVITCTYENAAGEFASVMVAVRVHSKDVVVGEEKISLQLTSSNNSFNYAPYMVGIDDEILSASLITAGGTLSLELDGESVEIGRRMGDCTIKLSSRNYNYMFNVKLSYSIEIGQGNISDLLTLTKEDVVLTEDIDIKQYLLDNEVERWNSQVDFDGVFDGDGYVIKNLACGQNGLFRSFNGSLKDITIIGTLGNKGIIGDTCGTEVSIENLIVKAEGIEKEDVNGVLFKTIPEGATVSIAKTIISLPKTTDENIGFIAGKTSSNVNVTNCYFIQGNGKSFGEIVGQSGLVGTVNTYADVSVAYEAFNNSEIITEELKGQFEDVFVVKISNDNKQKLKEITTEYVVLTEDITFQANSPEFEFLTGATFTGILDGQGYSIDTLLLYSNGLFKNLGGTIKNLTLHCSMRGGNTGAVAAVLCGDTVLENVLINLLSPVGGTSRQGGVVCTVGEKYTLTMKNCFINGDITEDVVNRAFIARLVEGKVVLENVYACGFSGRFIPEGLGEISTESKNYAIYESIREACVDIINNEIEIGEFVEKEVAKLDNAKYITQSNLSQLIGGTADAPLKGTYLLMEDIDLSQVEYTASGVFAGTFDGQGYAIKNLSPDGRYGGFFELLGEGAVIKNVAFVNVDLSGEDIIGTIGSVRSGRSVRFENVFVTIANTELGTATGGLLGETNSGELTCENVFIYHNGIASSTPDRSGFLVGRFMASGHLYLRNCHFVGNGACLNTNNDGLVGNNFGGDYFNPTMRESDYHTYENMNAVNVNNNTALTDFMKTCIAEFIDN